jgi:hypothetical protein
MPTSPTLPQIQGKTLSIFGLLRTDNQLISYPTTKERTNADFIIRSLDHFAQKIDKLNVFVIDNTHFPKAKIKQWQQQGLFIFSLGQVCGSFKSN